MVDADVSPNNELLQGVIFENTAAIQDILDDPALTLTQVNWQDQLGWTPLVYAAFRGDYKLVKKLINRGASVNHMALSRAGSSADGTSPLHACAAMRPGGDTAKEGFYETARVLMLAGSNPYQENLSGLTPIDVAANRNNRHMKVLLEGCALFKGTLALPTPKLFGAKISERYCLVLPRFPWHPLGNQNGLLMRDGNPVLSLVCYKEPEDVKPVIKILLDGARVVVEGGSMAEEGYLIVKCPRKQLKGVSAKSSTSTSSVIEVRARASATQTGGQVLQSLAEVCKSAAVAAYCGNLGQLCEASMIEALHNLGLSDGLLPLPGFQPVGSPPAVDSGRPVAPEVAAESAMLGAVSGEKPKARKSLSLSGLIRGPLRRMSLGDRPRRHSISHEVPANRDGTLAEVYSGPRLRQPRAAASSNFGRISEDDSEFGSPAPLPATRAPPTVADPRARRLSLQQHDLDTARLDNPSLSLQSRYSQSKERLASNQGIPVDFWGGMREEMMRRSIDGRARADASRRPSLAAQRSGPQGSPPPQPVNVQASFDVGDLEDVLNPQDEQLLPQLPEQTPRRRSLAADRATSVLDARRPEESTMQDRVKQAAERPSSPDSYEQWRAPAVPAVLVPRSQPAQPAAPRKSAERSGPLPAAPAAGRRSLSGRSTVSDTTGAARRGHPQQSPSSHSPPPTVKSEPPIMPPRGEEGLLKGDAVMKAIAHREARARARSAHANGKAPAGPAPGSNSRPPVANNLNNLAWISTNRSDKSRSSGRPPAPASKVGHNTNSWFASDGNDDEFFHWSLRPESHRTPRSLTLQHSAAPPSPKPPVDPAVVRWAAEAAAMVNDDQLSEEALDELAQAGWRQSTTASTPELLTSLSNQPSGETLPSLDTDKEESERAAGKAAEARPSGWRLPASKPPKDTLSVEAEHAALKACGPPMPQSEGQGMPREVQTAVSGPSPAAIQHMVPHLHAFGPEFDSDSSPTGGLTLPSSDTMATQFVESSVPASSLAPDTDLSSRFSDSSENSTRATRLQASRRRAPATAVADAPPAVAKTRKPEQRPKTSHRTSKEMRSENGY